MRTIQEAADELGVTPQAIYKKLNKTDNGLKQHLKHVEKNGKSVKALTDQGMEILKELFNSTVETTVNKRLNNQFKTSTGENAEVIDLLQETVKTLNRQLEVKDKQIQDLNDRLREQQELNRNNQVLLRNEQQKALPSGTTWERFKGIFRRDNQEEP